jgi:hypothetical protein
MEFLVALMCIADHSISVWLEIFFPINLPQLLAIINDRYFQYLNANTVELHDLTCQLVRVWDFEATFKTRWDTGVANAGMTK